MLETRRLLSTVPTGFTETLVASGLTTPTAMAIAPDGRVFLSQISGEVKLVKNNALQAGNVLTVSEDTAGERGLLGVTLDPNFGTAGGASDYLYLYYTANSPTIHNRLSRYLITGDSAGAEQQLVNFPDVGSANIHQGGALAFGGDGKLYVTIGDMGTSSNAPLLTTTLGKVLRFNADGSIPTDNPFYAQTTGLNRSIWARGLRHAFTTAFAPGPNGAFYINDVGENAFEEIDLGAAGADYGWPATEGTFNQASFPNYTNPIYAYSHAVGQCIVGGAVYSGVAQTFPSQYSGKYFFGDFVQGWIKSMDPTTKVVTSFATGAQYITGLRVAPDGALWYLRGGDQVSGGSGIGQIYRVQYTAAQAPVIALQPQSQTVPVGESVTFSVSATGTSPFTYQWQRNNANINGATSASYTLPSVALSDTNAAFRCIVTNVVNSATSDPATLTVTTNTRPVPTILTPVAGKTYGGNDVIQYSGAATDAEDGTLGASRFTWRVDLHHDTHFHPFVPPTTGSTSGQFTIPTSGETSPNVSYRITLTVTDSGGLTQTTIRDVFPRESNLSLATNIAGLAISLDGQPIATFPSTTLGVEGITRTLDAPATQVVGGATYQFVAWSDGGAANHAIAFPSSDQTITAYYRKLASASAYLSDLAWTGTPTNGWGPVEKDMSNGENAAGDGATIKLNGVSYAKGLGTHAASSITYFYAAGAYQHFLSDIGIDDEITSGGSVVFQVYTGTTLQYDSGTMTAATATKSVDVTIPSTATSLRLVVTDGGNGNTNDHADWAGARVTSAGAAPLTLNGTSASDSWTLRLNSAGTALDVLFNSSPLQTFPLSSFDSVLINGLAGDDVLTLDTINGPFTGVGQITFDGGANGAAGDQLGIVGSSGSDTFDVTASTAFIAALPITYVNAERVRFDGLAGSDTLNVNESLGAALTYLGGSNALDTIDFRGGSNTLTTDAGASTSGVAVRIDNSASVNATATQHVGAITMTGNGRLTLATNGNRLLRASAINLSGNAAIDLNDNDLIASGTSRAGMEAFLRSAAIFSTAANNSPQGNTAVGLLTGAEYADSHGGLFDGEQPAAGDVLLKYTYFGDVDFNGAVDSTDYNLIDFGFLTSASGWANGDVDYNGAVDSTDYNLIDFAFVSQGATL